jgi:2-dehydro-3-deoxy-D-gluconate 5-dehydrogenase
MTIQQNPSIAQLFDLTGKAAIVTGGAMGIGQGIALRLAEAGAGVMVTDINLEAATNTVNQIRSKGGKAEAIKADASSASANAWLSFVQSSMGAYCCRRHW